jgi:hypothetical protein
MKVNLRVDGGRYFSCLRFVLLPLKKLPLPNNYLFLFFRIQIPHLRNRSLVNDANQSLPAMRDLLYSLPLLYCLVLYMSGNANAQAPQKFTFQGLALDDFGQPIANSTVQLRFKIHQSSPAGITEFIEQQIVSTSSSGLFTAIIGGSGGNMENVNWKSDVHFLRIEIDPTKTGQFATMSVTQLLSVPYALYTNEAGKWKDDDPIVQKGTYGSGGILPNITPGTHLIWYPKKSTFRAGLFGGDQLQDINIGDFSFATGWNTKASGIYSVALGASSTASGDASLAFGPNSEASSVNSICIGLDTKALAKNSFAFGNNAHAYSPNSFAIGYSAASLGDYSISLGHHTVSSAKYSLALGLYNNSLEVPTGGVTDRLFQIGNGTGINNRSNALTILRNGNVGVGSKVITPEFILDIGARPRIRHEGNTAGLYLNNSQNNPEGFVGMKTDTQIGFYLNGAWRFWINEQGQAWTSLGQLGFASSDLRLKKDLLPLKNSLLALCNLRGYHYNWIDPKRDQTLQTGVIAQEVEKYFPELVQTGENGFKSVNYIGLIPHLIESVKELKSQTAEIATLRQELAELRDFTKKLLKP